MRQAKRAGAGGELERLRAKRVEAHAKLQKLRAKEGSVLEEVRLADSSIKTAEQAR